MFETDNAENLSIAENLVQLNESLVEAKKLLRSVSKCIGLDDWVNQKTAQEVTGLSKSTLYNLRQRGQLTWSSFTGKEVFYRRSDLIRFLDKRERMRA